MTTMGLFAGRGDVILSMLLALTFGLWLGWQLRGLLERIRSKKRT